MGQSQKQPSSRVNASEAQGTLYKITVHSILADHRASDPQWRTDALIAALPNVLHHGQWEVIRWIGAFAEVNAQPGVQFDPKAVADTFRASTLPRFYARDELQQVRAQYRITKKKAPADEVADWLIADVLTELNEGRPVAPERAAEAQRYETLLRDAQKPRPPGVPFFSTGTALAR